MLRQTNQLSLNADWIACEVDSDDTDSSVEELDDDIFPLRTKLAKWSIKHNISHCMTC